MFNVVRRSLISKGAISARLTASARATRAFSAAAVRLSDSHEKPPMNLGPGAPSDHIPTNFEQATGAERSEYVAALEGKDYFDMGPLLLKKKGTKADPTIVPSGAESRIVGCNGAPGEDHELLWIVVERKRPYTPCPHCGNVYKLSEKGFDPNSLPNLPGEEYHGF
ncbi:Cytochrome c oxidase subunit 4 [Coemansia spiralis]|uniref:Cytochrome c oxidase subunit 4 n=2 Tax=Coemansia TaxID=4863 RepID=A0A9W8G9X4_9FUNG|nr:Cytochrome c oxidase subunit 4 [Coemansia umbellata]KAJ2625221.1 Cytochrome c oxidase subunit 4 [Coemansia sp. RSA 1358]KAJ2677927.1 Cytochrome c oxidase subunit 4 [Coemansia spiralis]